MIAQLPIMLVSKVRTLKFARASFEETQHKRVAVARSGHKLASQLDLKKATAKIGSG